METLQKQQQEIINTFKKIERNFAKDSSSHKTRKYLNEKLDTLDKLWAEFQSISTKLTGERDYDPISAEEEIEKTREYFEALRLKIASFPPTTAENAPVKSPRPIFMEQTIPMPESKLLPTLDEGSSSTSRTAIQVSGKANELLSLQYTNFRALVRLINGLRIEEICEKWELEDELRNIQSRWATIDSLHLQIDNLLQGSNQEYENEFMKLEISYKDVKRSLNKKLSSTAHTQQSTPRIEIPVFSGNYTQWPTFYDLYMESIHNNNVLTNSQKMQHLKGKLRGEAERLVMHLNITSDNYNTAWELLKNRYNNPQLLFTKHVELFLNQTTIQKQSAFEIKRLFDKTSECLHAIQNLGINTETWDPLLVHLISKKLDSTTYSDYKEARKSPRELPTLSELMDFLEAKFIALEPINKREKEVTSSHNNQQQQGPSYKNYSNKRYHATVTCSWTCPLCKQGHGLYNCNEFTQMSSEAKLKTVNKLKLCKNCLFAHGENNACHSKRRCKLCQQKHSTMLHEVLGNSLTTPNFKRIDSNNEDTRNQPSTSKTRNNSPEDKQHCVNHVAGDHEEILLTTLSLKVKGADGCYVILRALLDQGSQISLISENASQRLNLPRQQHHASISGIGAGTKQSKGVVTLDCLSIYDDFQFSTQALVINKLINKLPNISFNKQSWSHLDHIRLADPEYNISRPIDLLLDASVYSNIIMNGLIRGTDSGPIAQQTRMGWILSGSVPTFKCNVVINSVPDLSAYWEMEEIHDSSPPLTQEDQYCEVKINENWFLISTY